MGFVCGKKKNKSPEVKEKVCTEVSKSMVVRQVPWIDEQVETSAMGVKSGKCTEAYFAKYYFEG